MAVVLHHIHIAAQNDALFAAEVLGLTPCRHQTAVGMQEAHIAAGRDHTGLTVGGLLIRLQRQQAGLS